jgi:hypothetical protein
MRFVQGGGVYHGPGSPHTLPDEFPITDRADALREWGGFDVQAQRGLSLHLEPAHQRFTKVTGASGYEYVLFHAFLLRRRMQSRALYRIGYRAAVQTLSYEACVTSVPN